jgi:hypothetical protein
MKITCINKLKKYVTSDLALLIMHYTQFAGVSIHKEKNDENEQYKQLFFDGNKLISIKLKFQISDYTIIKLFIFNVHNGLTKSYQKQIDFSTIDQMYEYREEEMIYDRDVIAIRDIFILQKYVILFCFKSDVDGNFILSFNMDEFKNNTLINNFNCYKINSNYIKLYTNNDQIIIYFLELYTKFIRFLKVSTLSQLYKIDYEKDIGPRRFLIELYKRPYNGLIFLNKHMCVIYSSLVIIYELINNKYIYKSNIKIKDGIIDGVYKLASTKICVITEKKYSNIKIYVHDVITLKKRHIDTLKNTAYKFINIDETNLKFVLECTNISNENDYLKFYYWNVDTNKITSYILNGYFDIVQPVFSNKLLLHYDQELINISNRNQKITGLRKKNNSTDIHMDDIIHNQKLKLINLRNNKTEICINYYTNYFLDACRRHDGNINAFQISYNTILIMYSYSDNLFEILQ